MKLPAAAALQAARLRRCCAIAIAAAATTLGAAAAEALRLDGVMPSGEAMIVRGVGLTVPAGWRVSQRIDGVGLTRSLPTGKTASLLVAVNNQPQGSPAALLRQIAQGLRPVLRDDKPLLSREGRTLAGDPARAEVWCCGGKARGRLAAVAAPSATVVLVAVNAGLGTEDERQVERDFAAVLRSVRTTPDAPSPPRLAALAGAHDLSGLYQRVRSGNRMNALGGLDYFSEIEFLYFEPQGWVSSEPPTAPTLAQHCKVHWGACGAYAVIGKRLRRSMVDADYALLVEHDEPLRRGADKLVIDDADWWRVEPPKELRLDGTYTNLNVVAGATAQSSGSVHTARSFRFWPDGRYRLDASSGAAMTQESGDTRTGFASGNRRPALEGTYTIDRFTLTLKASDGSVSTRSIVLAATRDSVLVINGGSYLKEGR